MNTGVSDSLADRVSASVAAAATRRTDGFGAVVCGGAAAITLILAAAFGARIDGWALASLAAAPAFYLAMRRWTPAAALRMLFVAAAVIALALWWQGRLPTRPYGDGRLFGEFLDNAYVFPRWMLGMTLAVSLHTGLWKLPAVAASLPPALASGGGFAVLFCLTCMTAATLALLGRWNRLPVWCVLLTPVWLLFSSGYVEYYAVMIGVWAAVLAWVFERPLESRHPVAIGVLVGILPATYVALAPFSVLLAAAYIVCRPRDVLIVAGAAAATLAVAISVSYPTIPAYLQQLYAEMNFGDQHSHPRYQGLAASPTSILLATRYVFRPFHLSDVGYMAFWGGGWLCGPALVALAGVRLREAEWRDVRVWFGTAVVAWQVGYLLWMLPKAGPLTDVDLFCPTFVVLAFMAGLLAEGTRWRHLLLAGLVGVDVVTAFYLVSGQLPAPF